MTKRHHRHKKHHRHHQPKEKSHINNFNEMIDHATKRILCDSKCQRVKKIKQLKDMYLESKQLTVTAPDRERTAFKRYYEFLYGAKKFNEVTVEKFTKEADHRASLYSEKFSEEVKNIEKDITYIHTISKNYNNLMDYEKKLIRDNEQLMKLTKTTSADIITNDRKSYYENQGVDQLHFYNKMLQFAYVVILCAFVVSIFAIPTDTNKTKQFAILFVLVLYPFFCMHIARFAMNLYNRISKMLPGNAYVDMEESNNHTEIMTHY
tara:strand:- start:310 stop:1101 length:792 start_codon:yes stop_codon:yes gene_type:complete